MIEKAPDFENTNRRSLWKNLSTGTAGLALGSLVSTDASATTSLISPNAGRVSLVPGTDHMEVTYQSLKPFENEVEKAIQEKQVIIKPKTQRKRCQSASRHT